ncbi:hypothetical protein OH492_01665 [Vibrio chagasii]|nr:hypothetical protein [Vibrio chagasii]
MLALIDQRADGINIKRTLMLVVVWSVVYRDELPPQPNRQITQKHYWRVLNWASF